MTIDELHARWREGDEGAFVTRKREIQGVNRTISADPTPGMARPDFTPSSAPNPLSRRAWAILVGLARLPLIAAAVLAASGA